MKKYAFFHKLLILIIAVAMMFSLTSCGQQKKPIPSPSKAQEEQNKPPKELDELSKAIEKMEKSLSDMYERSKKPLFIQMEEITKQQKKEKQGGGSEQEQGGNKQQGGGSSGDSSGGSGGQQQGQGQPSSSVELVTPESQKMQTQLETQQMQKEIERANLAQFEQLNKDVLELHALWNAFEAKAVSQFVMQSSIVDFENTLNNLTKSLSKSDAYNSLLDANQLFKYIPDFLGAYTSDSPPEIGKLRFAAKKIYLLSEKEDYAGADEVLQYLSGIWLLTRPRISQENMDMVNQFEFATSDLKNAIEQKNNIVIKAKTEVITKVADELEKASAKKKEK